MNRASRYRRRAFTLVELLVVIGLIGLLLGILLPALSAARKAGLRTACLSNQHQIGLAIHAYASDYGGTMPYGPKAPPPSPTNFYPGTGDVTNLLSLQDGQPVALGLMLAQYLSATPRVLFCPGADQPDRGDSELAKVGVSQAQGDYYYRHASSGAFSDLITPPRMDHIRLSALGDNTAGQSITALVMDQDYIADAGLASFGIATRTNHDRKIANVLYSDGHASTLDNSAGRFTINPGANPYFSFGLILKAFEYADTRF